MGRAVLQYSHCTCDTARAQGVQAAGGPWADWALGAKRTGRRRRRAPKQARQGLTGRAA